MAFNAAVAHFILYLMVLVLMEDKQYVLVDRFSDYGHWLIKL